MKVSRIRTVALATLFLVCFVATASASVIGDLKTSSGNGTMTFSLLSTTFNVDTSANPAGPPWNSELANTTSLTFAGCPSGVLGTAGCLDSGAFTPAEGILLANGNPIVGSAGLGPNNPFIQFAGNGVTHATILYTVLSIGPGAANTNCQALVNIGDSCSLFAGSPIVLTLGPTGTSLFFGLGGTVTDGAGVSNWIGQISSSIVGMTPGQVQLFFCPSGTCLAADFSSGRSITKSFTGDFLASAGTSVPEPSTTASTLVGGLILLAALRGRKSDAC